MRKLPFLTIIFLVAIGCKGPGDAQGSESEELVSHYKKWSIDDKPAPPKPPVMDLSVLKSVPYQEVFNDSNYIQYMSAERLGIDPLHSLSDVYYTRRPLVKIESGENYRVDNLTHSMPFLVPEAAELLDEIGSDFRKAIKERGLGNADRILVTSLLRSPYTVKRLKTVNANAVDSSTHMFATTFDISYNAFVSSDSGAGPGTVRHKEVLAEVLLNKRNQGKCFVKYEIKSPCFHITVNKP